MTYQSPSWRRSLALNSSAGSTSAAAAAAASASPDSSSASAVFAGLVGGLGGLVSVGFSRVGGLVSDVGFGRSRHSLGLFPGFHRGVLALIQLSLSYLELLLRHLVSCFLIA